jgi:hypothetical protein
MMGACRAVSYDAGVGTEGDEVMGGIPFASEATKSIARDFRVCSAIILNPISVHDWPSMETSLTE